MNISPGTLRLAEPAASTSSRLLADAVMASLAAFFSTRDHRPSAEHWHALRAIAETMEDMADGVAESKVFLSSVDPGGGKTQTVAHFARALVASAAHQNTGMVICVGRLAEAEALVAALDVPRDRLAVLTSRDSTNALGGAPVDDAQVLITTQQRVEKATADGRAFNDTVSFFYRGAPRAVRVWDEAWLPGRAATLGQDDLLFLVKLIRPMSSAFADHLLSFSASLGKQADGALVDVPDFEGEHGVALEEVLAAAIGSDSALRDDQQNAAVALRLMSGQSVRCAHDGPGGSALLTYTDHLPEDLRPLLVLDASGRVRDTYRQIEQHRGGLVRLPAIVKDYSPLTIYSWRTGGSKTAFAAKTPGAARLTDHIAATIASKPAEDWLVVIHRRSGKVGDVEHQIRRALPVPVTGRLRFLPWGQHMATNDFADVPNVILAGTLFMAPSYYRALTHMVQAVPVANGAVSHADIIQTQRGENANLVLQAVCRGRVRKSDGPRCLPMTAYIIAAARSGIPDDLPAIFPGAKVLPWGPQDAPKGNVKKALDYVRVEMGRGAQWVPHSAICKAIGLDRSNCRARVLRSAQWQTGTADLGLVVARGPGRGFGLRRTNVVG